MKKYKLAVCGGTFDLLHDGHKQFLSQIFLDSDKVIIGLTSDNFAAKKNLEIQSFKNRKNELFNYLKSFKPAFEIVEINDVYGPLLKKDLNADVLFVTSDTKNGSEIINSKRGKIGLPKLKVEIVQIKKSQDGLEISSTRIRNGEINRHGDLYFKKRLKNKNFILPSSFRKELQKPFGRILEIMPVEINSNKTITIGDVTTKYFNDKNLNQKISIIDFKVQRNELFKNITDLNFNKNIKVFKIKNPAGTIQLNLETAIKNALKHKDRSVILIEGEEDLSVIPVILASPLGFKIYYGQPPFGKNKKEGLVEVIVTEESKEKIFNLLNKFELL